MFSLIYNSPKSSISLLILQLLFILLLPMNNVFGLPTTSLIYTTMPVTTRSQTKTFKKSLLYTGLSNTTISSLIPSPAALSDVYATDNNELMLQRSTIDLSCQDSSSSSLPTLSSSSVSLDFEKNLTCFEILENQISKSVLPIDPGPLVSHNICTHTNLEMEEDCEEH
jgi:hypothetical protein